MLSRPAPPRRLLAWSLLVGVIVRGATAGAAEGVAEAPAEPQPPGPPPVVRPPREAPPKDTETGEGRVIVPLVMYTPETHVGLGGLVVQFFRVGASSSDSRVSSVAFIALVTTRKQMIFEVIPDIYWDDEQNHVTGKLEYQRYPDSYFGIGPRTRADSEERYERERLRFRGGPRRRFFGAVYAGLTTDVMQYDAVYTDANGLFATRSVPGEDGGFTAGLGPTAQYDTRDNAVSSRKGTLAGASFVGFAPATGSRYEFWKLTTEARQFFPVGTESALGLRYYGEFQRGDVPYYQLAMLGGDELLRGYFLGRFRDRNLVALEAEYRFPLFWRFGAVAFAGAGDVAPELHRLSDEPIRFALGGGLRAALNTRERLNLRLDVGAGPDTFGVYFTAREAF